MATRVDLVPGKVAQTEVDSVKPTPGPKPLLTTKPFSLKRNAIPRSILPSKTFSMPPDLSQTGTTGSITTTVASTRRPGQPTLNGDSTATLEPTNASNTPPDNTRPTDSNHTKKLNQADLSTCLTTPTSETPTSIGADPTETTETNKLSGAKPGEQGDSDSRPNATGPGATPLIRRQTREIETARWRSRKRLSMELTSRFETASPQLHTQKPAKEQLLTKRETPIDIDLLPKSKDAEKTHDPPGTPSDLECSLKQPAPLEGQRNIQEVEEKGAKKVSTIQRRISLLLDASSRPQPSISRKEAPPPIKQDGCGGVKQLIKGWVEGQMAEKEEEKEEDQVPLYKPVERLVRQSNGGTKQEPFVDQIGTEVKLQKEPELEERVKFETESSKLKEVDKEMEIKKQKVRYDDFSVKQAKPLVSVIYDDFSAKPRRWGSKSRLPASPAPVQTPPRVTEILPSSHTDLQTGFDTQEPAQDSLARVEPQRAERDTLMREPSPVDWMEEGTEKEREGEEEESEEEEGEEEEGEEQEDKEDEEEEGEFNLDPEKEEGKAAKSHDTDTLIGEEPDILTGGEPDAPIGGESDQQNEGSDTRLSEDDSPQTSVDQTSAAITTNESDGASLLEETEEPLPFPDISAPLLDTSLLRSRAELRKSRRTRPPRIARQSSATAMPVQDKEPIQDWRFCDSTDTKELQGDTESDEEQPRERQVMSPPSQPQRVSLFSGMDPSILKAQLKKREGGGGEGADTERDMDRSQLSSSPGRSSFLPGASRVLPLAGNQDGAAESSPSWLQELKSKKRFSQHNSET
ncbi:hypothetical protein UPYG_G00167410 [Umbra pygmaea]|uniref:Tankyrase 1-binding protein C-terminal domain-containing protein n=1 Tax=Umbra pygmaea TaxID=75934 RepID=A0ABD0WN74_UMBPY